MAGFVDRSGTNPIFGQLSKGLKLLSKGGMMYEDMVIKQSRAVGVSEAEFGMQGYLPEEFLYSLSMSDIGAKKFIAYFDKEYKSKREYLRKFALNGEIEFILDTICDEAIVMNDNNFFADVNTSSIESLLSGDNKKTLVDDITTNFRKIYTHFHFLDGHDGWLFFRQFLIDGFLAFEIIYDVDGKNIIGFKDLDPVSLRSGVEKSSDGVYRKIWVQYEDIPSMKRVLLDSQVIYISYAKGNFTGHLSYVERLVRSFNLLRLMENSRIIWNIMNSSYRLKMVVPIGSKSPQKAKESLAEMMHIYKEDIALDWNSGEISVNGKPSMQFYKNYLFPSKNGEQPELEVIGGEGPDLSDTDALKYFKDKLKEDSKIPFSRFDHGGGASITFGADGMEREEIRFFKFITRLRSIFQEVLIKPLYLQMCLSHEELQNDELFKSALSLSYNKDNMFEEMKEYDIMQKRIDFISSAMQIMDKELDSSGTLEDVSYFDPKFVIKKYLKLSDADVKANDELKNARKEEQDKKIKQIQAAEGM